jgi:sulfate permease, SulP family
VPPCCGGRLRPPGRPARRDRRRLALIPEAISFSIIAGVDPKVGLYASFSIAIIIAFAGGRRRMISAATGAMALVMVRW